MGFDQTFVVARWDRPLTTLAANSRIGEFGSEPEEDLSWTRADGWQCYAPAGGYYDGELIPPVQDIAAETGGPVLGLGVSRSDHYRVSFLEGETLHSFARGWDEGEDPEPEMIERWGNPWEFSAASALTRWARPFVNPATSLEGLRWAIVVPQLFAEQTVFDLLRLLTLVPDPQVPPWWAAIPDAMYAVDATELRWQRSSTSNLSALDTDVSLAFTRTGVGVWSLARSSWEVEPTEPRAAYARLRNGLPERR
jgi:hypothetical protein